MFRGLQLVLQKDEIVTLLLISMLDNPLRHWCKAAGKHCESLRSGHWFPPTPFHGSTPYYASLILEPPDFKGAVAERDKLMGHLRAHTHTPSAPLSSKHNRIQSSASKTICMIIKSEESHKMEKALHHFLQFILQAVIWLVYNACTVSFLISNVKRNRCTYLKEELRFQKYKVRCQGNTAAEAVVQWKDIYLVCRKSQIQSLVSPFKVLRPQVTWKTWYWWDLGVDKIDLGRPVICKCKAASCVHCKHHLEDVSGLPTANELYLPGCFWQWSFLSNIAPTPINTYPAL